MPPVGTAPDAPVSQGPPPPISVGSEASKVAGGLYAEANQKPLDQNVPSAGEQLAPPEEAVPTNVMPAAAEAFKVPVAAAPSPTPVEAAPDPMAAFAPKPPENPYAQAPSAIATPTEQADQRMTPPKPDWEAMAKSTKAGASTAPTQESATPGVYDALSTSNLDRESTTPEAQASIEALSALSKNPAATLAAATEMARSGDEDGLRALAPALRQVTERIENK